MRKIIVLLMLIVIPSIVLAQTGRKVSERTLLTSPTADDLVDCVDTGSSTSYKCTMGGIVALADNVNWSTMDTISTINNSDKFVVNSSGANKSINWDTFEDVITDNINWTAYENVSTLNGADSFWVNVGGTNKEINWTDLEPLTGASTWTKSGTNVYLTTTSDNVGVGTTVPDAKFVVKNTGTFSGKFFREESSTTGGVQVLEIKRMTTGTATNNIGAMLDFSTEDSAGNSFATYRINSTLSDVTDGSEDTTIYEGIGVAGSVATTWVKASPGYMGFNNPSGSAPTAVVDIWGETSTTGKAIQVRSVSTGTVNLTIEDGGNIGIGSATPEGKLIVRTTNDIGWAVVNSANQACNTTCSSGCVFGMDTSAIGNFLSCTDATADTCVCAGSN